MGMGVVPASMITQTARHIAVVEDDHALARLIGAVLEEEGYRVSIFGDALPFLRYVCGHGLPHLVLIDLRLPSMHGFELSNRLKASSDVPIIFISSVDEVDTIVTGLKLYADDYLTKPFDMREMAARVHRVLSRMSGWDYAQSPIVQIDDWLSIDFGQRRVYAGGRCIPLTPTEASLLHILVSHAGRAVAAETLLARVWPLGEVYEEALRVHMHRLRRKLERDCRHPQYIQTVRGVGYQFSTEQSPATALPVPNVP